MSSHDIRLRLVIRRHAVPEVKLVWPCAATEDQTIAKLLLEVNEVVPLEGGEWGLEDYAVELYDGQGGNSFECLHFQKVGKVLKEGDQVIIRALLSEDLKRRRLSGRHQISVDGSHLVDGVTFGRAWRPSRDRPPLPLPPRKRLRITYDESADEEDEDEDDGDEEPRQLLLDGPKLLPTQDASSVSIEAVFDDADRQDHVDFEDDFEDPDDFEAEDAGFVFNTGFTEDDPDFRPEADDDDEGVEDEDMLADEDLQEELRLLRTDNAILGESASLEQLDNGQEAATTTNNGLLPSGGLDLSWLDTMSALRSAFPLTSLSTLEAELKRQGQDIRRTYEALAKSNDPTVSFDDMLEHGVLGPLEALQTCGADEEDALLTKPTRPLIEEVESFDTPTEEAVENVAAPNAVVSDEARYASDDDTSSSDSSSGSDSDETSESDSEDEKFTRMKMAASRGMFMASDAEEDSDSSGESSSEDDSLSDEDDSSDDDEDDSGDDDVGEAGVSGSAESQSPEASDSDSGEDNSSEADSSDSSDESDSQSEPEELSVTATAARNQPQATQFAQLQSKSAGASEETSVTPHHGLSKTQKRNARRRDAKRKKLGASPINAETVDSQDQAPDQEFLARKQALLKAFDGATPTSAEKKQDETNGVDTSTTAKINDAQTPQAASPAPETSAQRRSRIDLGAGRRLLFGALGLKNPKNKADEDNLRQGLMKDVRPLKNARIEVVEEVANADPAEEDPNGWKERINYRAVECCHEGMVLSEPPFPFVQRWDPQQQYGSMRKRKRASQNFYDESYYEEDSQWYEQEAEADYGHQKKKSKGKKSKSKAHAQELEDGDEVMELNYDDAPAKPAGDEQSGDSDDLPPLPSDVAALPILQANEVKPGMVITWKQLLLSKATNWQPQLAAVTGLVLPDSTPDNVRIVLAKRDREQSQREYDEETGERIYDKFEVPDLDDEEDAEDDGHRDVAWAEMVEPRLVQREPSPSLAGTPSEIDAPNAQNGAAQTSDEPVKAKVSDNHAPASPPNPDITAQDEPHVEQCSAPTSTSERKESGTSFSIESGQKMPGLDLPTSGDAVQMSTSNDSLDTTKTHAASDVANSPTRQLQETSQAATHSETSPTLLPTGKITPLEQRAVANNAAEAGSEQMTSDTIRPPADVVMAEAGMGRNMEPGGISSDSKGVGEEVPYSNSTAERAQNEAAASQNSIHSGRQIQPDYGFGEPLEDMDEMVIPETLPEAHATPPPADEVPQTQVSSADSSPFPSLEEVFHSATTSRQLTSPVKPTVRSQPAKLKSDSAYDEAMRRLDEGGDSDTSPDKNKTIRSLFPNATQPVESTELSKIKEQGVRSAKLKSERLRKRSTPFEIPQGSQVISIGSSPISAQIKEVYAEDSVDETYEPKVEPKAGLSKGQEEAPKQGARGRKKALPRMASATTARVLKSKQPLSSAKDSKGPKARRKTGDRF